VRLNNLTILFCEDSREEINNKSSLMGVMGPALIFPELPANFPKLCIVLMADIHTNDAVEIQCDVSSDSDYQLPPALSTTTASPDGSSDWSLKIVLAIQNLAIPTVGSINVTFRVDNVEQRRSLEIKQGFVAPTQHAIM
jgi:hypothetical protein